METIEYKGKEVDKLVAGIRSKMFFGLDIKSLVILAIFATILTIFFFYLNLFLGFFVAVPFVMLFFFVTKNHNVNQARIARLLKFQERVMAGFHVIPQTVEAEAVFIPVFFEKTTPLHEVDEESYTREELEILLSELEDLTES